MKVKAPNGLVFDLPEAVATGLLASADSGFAECGELTVAPKEAPPVVEPEPVADEQPVKRRPGRPRKNETRANHDSSASRYGV